MKRTLAFLFALFIVSASSIFAQTEKQTIIGYLGTSTAREKEMFKNMSMSQINEAIEMYDAESMLEQYRQLSKEIRSLKNELSVVSQRKIESGESIESLRTMIINQIQLLRLTGDPSNIERAVGIMRGLINEDPSDIAFMTPYVNVMLTTADYKECERVLNLFEEHCSDEYDLARIHQNKAMLASNQSQLQRSNALYHYALGIYNKFAEKEGLAYKNVATKIMVSNLNLAQDFYKLQEKDSCLYYMEKVIPLGEIVSKTDSVDGLFGYANAFISMAQKYKTYGYTEKGDSLYAIAMKNLEDAYQKSPFHYGSPYTFYHMNHARDCMAKGQFAEAVPYADKALDVMTRLYNVLPIWSEVNYFEALRLRAELFLAEDKTPDGYAMLLEANKILDSLERRTPGGNKMRFFTLYYYLGLSKAAMDEMEPAIEYFEQAKYAIDSLEPRLRDARVAQCDKFIERCRKELEQ